MSNFFLIKVYRSNKIFFYFIISFLFLYSISFSKKMDMLFFPYNNMFAEKGQFTNSSQTTALKINGILIPITSDFYLKKDFSEISMFNFGKWVDNDSKDFMFRYLVQKKIPLDIKNILIKNLTSPLYAKYTWPIWNAEFHNITIRVNDTLSVWRYNLKIINNEMVVSDSSILLNYSIKDEYIAK